MLLATDSDRVRELLANLPASRPRRVVRSIRDLSEAFEETHAHAVLLDPNGVPESFLKPLIDQAASRGTQFFIASTLTTRTAELVLHSADSGLAGALLCDCETDLRAMTRQLSAEHCERVLRWSPIHIRRFRSDAEVLVGLTRALKQSSACGAQDARADKGDVETAYEAMAPL